MRILIVFGSTEGHTRDLASFAAKVLQGLGHEVLATPASGMAEHLSVIGWDAVIIAASLHGGGYQHEVIRFARTHLDALTQVPTAFISVSLSAAGHDPGDWEGLRRCVAELEEKTGWTPVAVHHAAGALRFSRYGLLKRILLRFIARQRGVDPLPGQDYDFTDYEELRRFVLQFAEGAAQRGNQARAHASSVDTPGYSLPEQLRA